MNKIGDIVGKQNFRRLDLTAFTGRNLGPDDRVLPLTEHCKALTDTQYSSHQSQNIPVCFLKYSGAVYMLDLSLCRLWRIKYSKLHTT